MGLIYYRVTPAINSQETINTPPGGLNPESSELTTITLQLQYFQANNTDITYNIGTTSNTNSTYSNVNIVCNVSNDTTVSRVSIVSTVCMVSNVSDVSYGGIVCNVSVVNYECLLCLFFVQKIHHGERL